VLRTNDTNNHFVVVVDACDERVVHHVQVRQEQRVVPNSDRQLGLGVFVDTNRRFVQLLDQVFVHQRLVSARIAHQAAAHRALQIEHLLAVVRSS